MKNLNLILIVIAFVLVMQIVSAETIPAGYMFYDNFNSGTLDTSKWTTSATAGSTYSPATEGNAYYGSTNDYAKIDQISGGGFGGELDLITTTDGGNVNELDTIARTVFSPYWTEWQTKVQIVFGPNGPSNYGHNSFLGFYFNGEYEGWLFTNANMGWTGNTLTGDIQKYTGENRCTRTIVADEICTFNFKYTVGGTYGLYGYLDTWVDCTTPSGSTYRCDTSVYHLHTFYIPYDGNFPFESAKFLFWTYIGAGYGAATTREFDVDYVAYKSDMKTSATLSWTPKGYYGNTNESVPFTISCVDAFSCDKSYYSTDGSTYTQGTSGTITAPANSAGYVYLFGYSKDKGGNENAHNQLGSVYIDRIAPTYWFSNAPTTWQKSAVVKVFDMYLDSYTGKETMFSCYDHDSYCDNKTFKLKTYPSSPGTSCPTTEISYDKIAQPSTTVNEPWMCAFGKDQSGNMGVSAPTQIKIDNNPPAVYVTGAPATWNKSATAGASCTDAESGCSASNTFKLALGPFISSPGNCASLDGPPSYLYISGINTPITNRLWVCAKAQDNVGNVNYSAPVEFLVDSTPPAVSITSPDHGSWQKNDFNVGYSARDTQSGVQSCKLSIRDGIGKSWFDKEIFACGSSKTITVGTGKYCSSPEPNGCGVRIWANDTVGNSGYAERNFSADLVMTVSISSPNAGSPQNKTFNVTYTADSPRISACKLFIKDGAGWPDKGNIPCGADKQISITVGTGKNCSVEGTNTCGARIWASDTTGASNQSERNFTIDYTNPSAIISLPDAGSWQNKAFNVVYSAADNLALSACKLFIRNGTGTWQDKGNINCAGQVPITVGTGKNCTVEGINACGVRIFASDTAGNLNQSERNFSIDYAIPSVTIIPKGANWTKSNISFNVSCYDIQNCTKVNYSYFNFSKFVFSREIAGNSKSLNISGNVTCNNGNACRVLLEATAVDIAGNMNTTTQSDLFLIDLQNPQIEKTECKFKATPTSSPAICKNNIAIGSTVTFYVAANDSDGSGVENLKIYLIKDGITSVPPTIVNNMLNKRKNATATIPISMANYDIIVEITDYVGNKINLSGVSFITGGDPTKKCAEQEGKLCNFYQVCSGTPDDKPSDAKENLGITCCFGGECLNRSTLSTCKQQGGEIYDNNLSTCLGTPVPASDTVEKNRCCKGGLTTKTNSLAWYDMAGNKISGAARGDKVKCVGLSNTDNARFDIMITLGNKMLFNQTNIKVGSTTKANSSIITLNETGTYKCEATFTASPPKKMTATLSVGSRPSLFDILISLNPFTITGMAVPPASLKVIEAPTKPRYTELPGFSAIAMMIAIAGLMIYYLTRKD